MTLPDPAPRRAVPHSSIAWSGYLIASLVVLALAYALKPSSSGHGTHTQLGLPPCGVLVVTGIPCPGCGLTTSFAHMVRGQLLGAVRANPFGLMLFLTMIAGMGVSVLALVRRSSVIETLDRLRFDRIAFMLVFSSLAVWGSRVLALVLSSR
ncbi:MAG: DUF2752 domain-containing protein [Myxococcota bacterium]